MIYRRSAAFRLPRVHAACARADARGFTLVELMTVVVIMGTLAVLGVASLRKHVSSSKSVEAFNMIQSIRAAQERWRAEHMIYLDVTSPAGGWYPADPSLPEQRNMEHAFFSDIGDDSHPDAELWLLLRPSVSGPVQFGYRTTAGVAGTTPTLPAQPIAGYAWPSAITENWYVIQALGDTDWDGTPSFYLASSLDGEVAAINEGE